MINGTGNPGEIYDVEAICQDNAGCAANYGKLKSKYGLGYIFSFIMFLYVSC